MTTEPLMTETEVAEWIRIKAATLRNWRHRGDGPPWVHVGRYVRYRPAAVREWLEKNEQGAA